MHVRVQESTYRPCRGRCRIWSVSPWCGGRRRGPWATAWDRRVAWRPAGRPASPASRVAFDARKSVGWSGARRRSAPRPQWPCKRSAGCRCFCCPSREARWSGGWRSAGLDAHPLGTYNYISPLITKSDRGNHFYFEIISKTLKASTNFFIWSSPSFDKQNQTEGIISILRLSQKPWRPQPIFSFDLLLPLIKKSDWGNHFYFQIISKTLKASTNFFIWSSSFNWHDVMNACGL